MENDSLRCKRALQQIRQLEDELGLLPPHDSRERISQIFERVEWFGKSYAPLGELIEKEFAVEAASTELHQALPRKTALQASSTSASSVGLTAMVMA